MKLGLFHILIYLTIIFEGLGLSKTKIGDLQCTFSDKTLDIDLSSVVFFVKSLSLRVVNGEKLIDFVGMDDSKLHEIHQKYAVTFGSKPSINLSFQTISGHELIDSNDGKVIKITIQPIKKENHMSKKGLFCLNIKMKKGVKENLIETIYGTLFRDDIVGKEIPVGDGTNGIVVGVEENRVVEFKGVNESRAKDLTNRRNTLTKQNARELPKFKKHENDAAGSQGYDNPGLSSTHPVISKPTVQSLGGRFVETRGTS
jgi:hypothetical protein